MNLTLLCDTLRPVLLKFFQTKRTIEDANTFIQSSSALDIDKDFLNLFSIMSNDSNTFSKELKEIGRKLTIGILRYPKEVSTLPTPSGRKGCSHLEEMSETYPKIDFDIEQIILEYKKQVNLLSKNILGQQIDNTCQTLEKRYWSRLLEDLDMEYYDDLLKILLGFRTNLLESLDGSGYTKETVMEYMDLEYIKQSLFQKSYRFIGLFQFIFDFVQSRLHPVLKETFTKLCSNFIESLEDIHFRYDSSFTDERALVSLSSDKSEEDIHFRSLSSDKSEEDIESNKSIVLCLQFITNQVIEFLYLDVEESSRDITEP